MVERGGDRGGGGRAGGTLFERILAVVGRVPRGWVVTYGQVARMAGRPGAARMVGWALHALPPGSDLPWHRVVNASGGISLRDGIEAEVQRALLEAEGIEANPRGRVDLERYRWDGRGRPRGRGWKRNARKRMPASPGATSRLDREGNRST